MADDDPMLARMRCELDETGEASRRQRSGGRFSIRPTGDDSVFEVLDGGIDDGRGVPHSLHVALPETDGNGNPREDVQFLLPQCTARCGCRTVYELYKSYIVGAVRETHFRSLGLPTLERRSAPAS